MANTTNYNWETPDDTDLVKDGAAAIRTLGNSIDTSFVDFKGGTTGQVLSKATNADLDYSWVTPTTGIAATIFDAKGDLIAASAADTAARLAVGTNGQILSADSTTATGLRWIASPSPERVWSQITSTALTGSSVTFSSLTLNNYLVWIDAATGSTSGQDIRFRFNSDSTAANYDQSIIYGFNQGQSYRGLLTAVDWGDVPSTGNQCGFLTISSGQQSGFKFYQGYSGVSTGNQSNGNMNTGFWRNSAALTSITILTTGGNFTGGTAFLYGA